VGVSGYAAGMARLAVVVFATVGILLVAAGLFVALAVGLPALGLNPYGRNPLDETLRGLSTAAKLYVVGAALLASALRWIRNHDGGAPALSSFWPVGPVVVIVYVWMAASRNWLYVPIAPLFAIGLLTPIAVGLWPRGSQATPGVRP